VSDPAGYLAQIMPAVRRRLDGRRALVPLAELKGAAMSGPRASFARAVGGEGISLIAEVKRASPSKGPIRPDLDVVVLVAQYEAAGAAAVSVLTEQDFFLGSLEDLKTAAAHTGLPLLRKDFIVDEYQLYEARVAGASAVLLIAALLDDQELLDLAGVAQALGMDVLLEVHDEAELERAMTVEGVVVGINNRDLRTFQVSLETTERLGCLVPADRLLVSESGISTYEDVRRLAAVGVDGVLVGESLLVAGDVQAAATALRAPLGKVVSACNARLKEAR
jgi:indole-3-glycerol phosphate synthase